MNSFRFAVFSDVHLGAPRFGEPALSQDAGLSLNQAITVCLEQAVDFVLIPGNLFHRPLASPQVLEQAETALTRLAGIPVVAMEGDREVPLEGSESYLLYLARRGLLRVLKPAFDSKDQSYAMRRWEPSEGYGSYTEPLPGVRVHSLGLGGKTADAALRRMLPVLESGSLATLGLFYGSRERLGSEDLRPLRTRLDFVACGHAQEQSHDGFAYHPGALVSIALLETKMPEPGMLLVEFQDGKFQSERIPIPGRPLVRLPDFPSDNASTVKELLSKLGTWLDHHPATPDSVVSLNLVGPVPFVFSELDPNQLIHLVQTKLKAAHVLIRNRLNLGLSEVNSETGPVDRPAIEREVLRETLEQVIPEESHRKEELLEILGAIRRRDLTCESQLSEILDLAQAYMERSDADH